MTTARRIARELAVIVMPQLPKDSGKLDKVDIDMLVTRAVHMLRDYATQNLTEANAILGKSAEMLAELEIEHPSNVHSETLQAVNLTSEDLRTQLENLERAVNFIAEALDIPDMVLHASHDPVKVKCRKCAHMNEAYIERAGSSEVRDFLLKIVSAYLNNKSVIDDFIKQAKSRWQVERMVSIDRDILRLACAEALFMPDVPVNVCISEAVELSHRFADVKAAKFINGILGDLAEEAAYFRRHGKFEERPRDSEEPHAMDRDDPSLTTL